MAVGRKDYYQKNKTKTVLEDPLFFKSTLLFFYLILSSLDLQDIRSPPVCSRAALVEALVPPCAPAVTTSWTAEEKDWLPSQPTYLTAWLKCEHTSCFVIWQPLSFIYKEPQENGSWWIFSKFRTSKYYETQQVSDLHRAIVLFNSVYDIYLTYVV